MNSKNKLKLFTYAITLIIGTTAVCFFVYNNIQNFEQVIINQNQQHLLNIAKSESIHFERFIDDVQDDLKIMALTPQIKNDLTRANEHNHLLKNISATEEYEAAKIMYDHFAGKISAIYAIDSNGIVKCRVPCKTELKSIDYSQKTDVKTVIINQQPYISELFKANSGHYSISVCIPVFEDEKFIGILRALIHTETMRNCLNDSKIGQRGYAWVIDDSGILISHPKTEHIGKQTMAPRKKAFPDFDWFELENIVAKMTSGQSGVGLYHSAWWQDKKPELVKKFIAFAPVVIGSELWSIGVSMGFDEISGPIKAHSRNLLCGAALIILLFISAGIGFYRIQKRQVELQVKVKSAGELKSINQKLLSEITERKKTEEKLKHAAEEWSLTFDSITDLVSIHDRVHSKKVVCKRLKILRFEVAFS
ncbi:MAG: cache domain-containing protein [Sedimentisphaerales bacterium]|nr:cache domain-containing protein [Sedimentisphaerales bacterium]